MLGTVDETDLCWLGGIPGGGLKEVFGIVAEEIDTLYPGEGQHAVMEGKEHELVDYCEVLQFHGAHTFASYTDGYYEGAPAVTAHRFGHGVAEDTGAGSLAEAAKGKSQCGWGTAPRCYCPQPHRRRAYLCVRGELFRDRYCHGGAGRNDAGYAHRRGNGQCHASALQLRHFQDNANKGLSH